MQHWTAIERSYSFLNEAQFTVWGNTGKSDLTLTSKTFKILKWGNNILKNY